MNRITDIPLLKAIILLLMVIGGFANSFQTKNCDTRVVKAVSFFSMCSEGFLRLNGSDVKADSKVNYTMYTINHSKSTAFLMYDPQQGKFICFKNKRRKKMFVAKRIPQPLKQCLLEEIPVLLSNSSLGSIAYTMYRLYNRTGLQGNIEATCKNNFCLSFNKNGSQKLRKNNRCRRHKNFHNIFLPKKQTNVPCDDTSKDFCRQMSKLHHKHHSHMPTEILQHCKLTKP